MYTNSVCDGSTRLKRGGRFKIVSVGLVFLPLYHKLFSGGGGEYLEDW